MRLLKFVLAITGATLAMMGGTAAQSNSRNGAFTDFIFIGDSWAEGAGAYEVCAGKSTVNRGVGGSTAYGSCQSACPSVAAHQHEPRACQGCLREQKTCARTRLL